MRRSCDLHQRVEGFCREYLCHVVDQQGRVLGRKGTTERTGLHCKLCRAVQNPLIRQMGTLCTTSFSSITFSPIQLLCLSVDSQIQAKIGDVVIRQFPTEGHRHVVTTKGSLPMPEQALANIAQKGRRLRRPPLAMLNTIRWYRRAPERLQRVLILTKEHRIPQAIADPKSRHKVLCSHSDICESYLSPSAMLGHWQSAGSYQPGEITFTESTIRARCWHLGRIHAAGLSACHSLTSHRCKLTGRR